MTSKENNLALTAILSSFGVAGITMGLLFPLVSIVLERRGISSTIIGLNSSVSAVATIIISPFIPHIIKRVGALNTIYVGIIISVFCISLFPVFDNLTGWFLLRFIMGACLCFHWIVSEIWINAIATDKNRGKFIGLYATVFAGGMAIGPLIITVTGTEGYRPFMVCAGLIFISAVPLYFARHLRPSFQHGGGLSLIKTVKKAPVVYVAALTAGLTEIGVISLISPYGLKIGFTDKTAALMLTTFVLGCIMLQAPIGWFADKLNKTKIFYSAAVISAIISMALPFCVGNHFLLWPMIFLWGGFLISFYTLGLINLGNIFKGGELAMANAAFIMAYEIGCICGPFLSGLGMDYIIPPHGFMGVIACGCILCLALTLFFSRQSRKTGSH